MVGHVAGRALVRMAGEDPRIRLPDHVRPPVRIRDLEIQVGDGPDRGLVGGHAGHGGRARLPYGVQAVALGGGPVRGVRTPVLAADTRAGAHQADVLPVDAHAGVGDHDARVEHAADGGDLHVGKAFQVDERDGPALPVADRQPCDRADQHERPETVFAAEREIMAGARRLRGDGAEREAALFGLGAGHGQMVVRGDQMRALRHAVHAVLALAARGEGEEPGQEGLQVRQALLEPSVGRIVVVGQGEQVAHQVAHLVFGAHGGRLGEQVEAHGRGLVAEMLHEVLGERAFAGAARPLVHVRAFRMAAEERGGERALQVEGAVRVMAGPLVEDPSGLVRERRGLFARASGLHRVGHGLVDPVRRRLPERGLSEIRFPAFEVFRAGP